MSTDPSEAHGLDLNSSFVAAADEAKASPADQTPSNDPAHLDAGKESEVEAGTSAMKEEAASAGVQSAARRRGRPRKSAPVKQEASPLPTCRLPFQDERKVGFAVTDLVWGKVRSHPWWPGQVFDPADASEMALKHQKKDHVLIAYFGDKTFAWSDESMLKPYQAHFAQMEGQSRTDTFVAAVSASLAEVARRVELALSCSCHPDDTFWFQQVENAGIQEGTTYPAIDAAFILNSFQPERFLGFVEELAQVPYGGVDRLELVITKAHLRAFNRSRGYPDLPEFVTSGGFEDEDGGSPAEETETGNESNELSMGRTSVTTTRKQKSRGRPSSSSNLKHVSEDGRKKRRLSELLQENDAPLVAIGSRRKARAKNSSGLSGEKHKVVDSDLPTSRKRKRLDSLGDIETKSPMLAHMRYSKIGECMRRAARQPSQSPTTIKSDCTSPRESPAQSKRKRHRVVDDHQARAVVAFEDYSSPIEMLSQLCLAARDPMKGYGFISTIVSFFSSYRNSIASSSSGDKELLKAIGVKIGTRKSASKLPTKDTSSPDSLRDSYWSDIFISENSEREPASSRRKGKRRSQSKTQKKKKRMEEEMDERPLEESLGPATSTELDGTGADANAGQELAADSKGEEVEECMPTALVMNFNDPDAIPLETDLIKIFSQYGSIKEVDIEILEKANRANVVFERRVDAEVAFSSVEQFSVFGPGLLSYHLRHLTSEQKPSHQSTSQGEKDASAVEASHSEVQVQGTAEIRRC